MAIERKEIILNLNPEELPLTCEERLEIASRRIDELEQALRKEIHFRTAKDMQGQNVWLYVLDALNLRMAIRKEAEPSIEKDRPWDKLFFTVDNDGRVRDVKAIYVDSLDSSNSEEVSS